MSTKTKFLYSILIFATQAVQAQVYPPLTEALELVWTDSTANYDPYDDQRPLIKRGVLFPYNNTEYAIEMKSGTKLFYKDSRQQLSALFEDSLLLFDTRKKAIVLNVFSGNVVLEIDKKAGAYNGYLMPTFVNNLIYVKTDKKDLTAYDISSGKEKWKFSTVNSVYTQPIIHEDKIILCDKTTIYALDKGSGDLLWKEELGERVTSNITVNEDMFYLWILPKGLVAFNPTLKQITWEYHEFDDQYGNYTLPISGDTIFFANEHLYAINKITGNTIWKSDEDCAVGSGYIASTPNFLMYYEGCSAGDIEFISAVKKDNGKKIYQGLTSDTFLPDNPDDPLNLSGIDYKKLKFVSNSIEGMTFAVTEGVIYAFKITR